MTLRKLTAEDLTTLRRIDIPPSELKRVDWTGRETQGETGWWRIVADVTCSDCGAYQAADSDPVNDKQVATTLTLGLFHKVGWRVDERDRVVCGDCVDRYGSNR
jgi:hypothetical protein